MTTTVTIKHEGPVQHCILVEIIHADHGLLEEITLAAGEEVTKNLYGPQSIHINELV